MLFGAPVAAVAGTSLPKVESVVEAITAPADESAINDAWVAANSETMFSVASDVSYTFDDLPVYRLRPIERK